MEVKFGDQTVNFGARARMKWAKLSALSVLQVFLRDGARQKFNAQDLPESVRHLAMMHGLKQKLADECAENVTPQEDFNSMAALWARLERGNWFSEEREAAVPILARAIAEVLGGDPVKIAEQLKGMKPAEKRGLEENGRIRAVMDRMEEEARKSVVPMDDEELLKKFGG